MFDSPIGLEPEVQKWVDFRDNHVYLGVTAFGEKRGAIAGEGCFDAALSADQLLARHRFDAFSFSEFKNSHSFAVMKQLFHRRRRGKVWRAERQAVLGKYLDSFVMKQYPPRNIPTVLDVASFGVLSPSVTRPAPNVSISLAVPWERGVLPVNVSLTELMHRFMEIAGRVITPKFGFMHLFPCCPYGAQSIPTAGRGWDNIDDVTSSIPLVSTIHNMRAVESELSESWTKRRWRGEPTNLYWGTCFDRGFARRSGLERFLKREMNVPALRKEGDSPGPRGALHSGDDFLTLFLSGDAEDCLVPTGEYIDRYHSVLRYLLAKDAIFPWRAD